MKNIGRPLRFASASAVSQVEYHTTPSAPIGCGLAPSSLGLGPLPSKMEVAALSIPVANMTLSVIEKYIMLDLTPLSQISSKKVTKISVAHPKQATILL
ncbi:MAG: hypothetical protein ACI9E1_000675 [Cryomorphaceae bacterium]|jgi:hypothetical protein